VQNSSDPLKEQILTWINENDFSIENMEVMTRFSIANGGIDYAISQMERFKNEAIDHLTYFEESDVNDSLICCAEFAASRSL
jgi:geranylgeranyl pyrophosphate synthase